MCHCGIRSLISIISAGGWIAFDSWLAVTVELILYEYNKRRTKADARRDPIFSTGAAVFENSKVSHLSDERKSWDIFNNI